MMILFCLRKQTHPPVTGIHFLRQLDKKNNFISIPTPHSKNLLSTQDLKPET